MTRWLRCTLALLLCGVGVVLGPAGPALATPTAATADAGVGTVIADLGVVASGYQPPGFSFDGAYYAYLVPAGDRCELRVWDLAERRAVGLTDTHVSCDFRLTRWAAHADTLVWQVPTGAGEVTEHAWDAGTGVESVLAGDAHVLETAWDTLIPQVSADGRYLYFSGRSDSHPAPPVDDPMWTGYVFDRSSGVSLPLSKPGVHVQFASWGPGGHTFVAAANGGNDIYGGPDACFGSGTSCRVVPDIYVSLGSPQWSPDGKAVIADPGDDAGPLVHDFTDSSTTRVPTGQVSGIQYARPFGAGGRWVLAEFARGPGVWDRTTGKVTSFFTYASTFPSPTGRYLLTVDDYAYGTFHTFDLAAGGPATRSTFLGTTGFWTSDDSTFLGVGPGGCTSLRQWSRTTNTISLFGPPLPRHCFDLPLPEVVAHPASASGRFAVVDQRLQSDRSKVTEYVADLRRHVLLGPVAGGVEGFAPGGGDVLALHQTSGTSDHLLLVDPTPVPDADDQPRWSSATPATGTAFDLTVGQRVSIVIGASDPQQTPVDLTFRWRSRAGLPVATTVPGWSCTQRRLAGGAVEADCTFVPSWPRIDQRSVDVFARNTVTGAQSDTRTYQVTSRPAPSHVSGR